VKAPAEGHSGWKSKLFLTLKTLLSLALLALLLARIPAREVMATLRAAHPFWLWSAAGLLLASNLIGSFQWERLLNAVEIRIPFWKVASYYHVGLFFNNFLPAGVGMDIARVMDASRYGRPKAVALSSVLMDRLVGTVALAGLALITTLPAINRFHLSLVYLALLGFFGFSMTLVWAVFHPATLPTVERGLSRIGLGGLKPHLEELASSLAGFRDRRAAVARLLSVALLVQLARIGVHVLVAQALGLRIPLTYFFLFVPLVAVIVSLPISLNGIGLREGAGVFLFGLIGVDRVHAFSLQFTTYLVAVAVSLIGGVVFLARIPGRRAVTRQIRRSS
jgi:uncharacterized protein (TIRG00374 family)